MAILTKEEIDYLVENGRMPKEDEHLKDKVEPEKKETKKKDS